MINYGYFRHRFDAHENIKLNGFVDEIGVQGYGYYYTLLEIYGAHYVRKNDDGFVRIHTRVIANVWRKRVDSCVKILERMEQAGLIITTKLQLSDDLVTTKLQLSYNLVTTKMNPTCLLAIPNFSKYFGSYKKTEPSIAPNKRKEKEIKEKSISPTPFLTSQKLTPDEIINHWNMRYGARFGHCPGVGGGKHRENILESLKYLNTLDDWTKLFDMAASSEFLSGSNKSDWTVNFLWLIDYDNALKVLSGNFDEQKIVNAIRKDFFNKVQDE